MAFHVACPITCRRICFCSLGFSLDLGKSKEAFCKEVLSVEELLQDPWGTAGVSPESTIQVRVPKLDILSVSLVPAVSAIQVDGAAIEDGGDDAEVEEAGVSAQAKRGPLQKVAASVFAAEDYARKLESGDVAVPAKDFGLEQHGHSNENVLCDLCFLGVKERGGRAGRMLPCKSCGKKYHRSCLKNWSQHRDLFHWSSWTCPSCQICEVCQKTGDPRKFAFCKRCDAAYHCYCQHPPHKNVGAGPYLCPKHTKCHSCGSSVPGNGLSVRWFLGYTCCDACGRLFVKGNYCPICLKVYRDSESTPMVCCDICQRWVHCLCDGISDEKYMQFQVDGNLQYKCATCRGECYQVKDLEDAVQQLWKKKDVADRELIASLRADAGLPTEEELFAISSYSDDDGDIPAIGRPLRLSLKLTDRTPKKSKEHGKIYSDKKIIKKKVSQASATSKSESLQDLEGPHYLGSDGYDFCNKNENGLDKSSRLAGVIGQTKVVPPSISHRQVLENKFDDDAVVSGEDKPSKTVKIRTKGPRDSDSENTGKFSSKQDAVKAKKLVINLGLRKANAVNLVSEASNRQVDPDMVSNGHAVSYSGMRGIKLSGKFGKVRSEDTVTLEKKHVPSKKENKSKTIMSNVDVPMIRGDGGIIGKHSGGSTGSDDGGNSDYEMPPTVHTMQKEARPLLKFKFRKPNPETQDSPAPAPFVTYERSNSIKRRRSKRKRLSHSLDKSSFSADEDASLSHQDSLVDEMLDASWILKKLGKGAKGKRVEIHEANNNSWHKGEIKGVLSSSTFSVTLDDGRVKMLELGKQGVRFVSQKQKRSKS